MTVGNKAEEINFVLSEPDVDLWKLRELALSEGGLMNDSLRKMAWPKLVGIDTDTITASEDDAVRDGVSSTTTEDDTEMKTKKTEYPTEITPLKSSSSSQANTKSSTSNNDYDTLSTTSETTAITATTPSWCCLDHDQIDRDVARCTWHLLTGSQRSKKRQMKNKDRKKISSLIKKKQRRLGNLINLVLLKSYGGNKSEDDRLRYYQGYHDIACVFLNTLGGAISSQSSDPQNPADDVTKEMIATGLDLPAKVLLKISRSHLRDSLRSNFSQLSAALRLVIMPLFALFDPELHAHLLDCDMEPFFAISWIITWFSHEIRDTALVKRLFDCFLVSHPLMPIYVSVAMVLHPVNRMHVLNAECDFASVHNVLAHLPRNSSGAGWKMSSDPDGGYVSNDESEEEETEDGNLSNMDVSYRTDDIKWEGRDDEEEEEEGSAVTSSGSSLEVVPGRSAAVPFQELIDLAISFMRRIPPRRLLPLARKYFSDDPTQPLLSISSSISLLQPPPSWGLASTAPSDWVLKKRALERKGTPSSSRRRRSLTRRRSRSPMMDQNRRSQSRSRSPATGREGGGSEDREGDAHFSQRTNKAVKQSILSQWKKSDKSIVAIIASGMGPDGDEEDRAARRRRRRLLVGGIAVAAISITYALVQSGVIKLPSSLLPSSSSSSSEPITSGSESTDVSTPNDTATEVCSPPPPADVGGKSVGSSSVPSSVKDVVSSDKGASPITTDTSSELTSISMPDILKETSGSSSSTISASLKTSNSEILATSLESDSFAINSLEGTLGSLATSFKSDLDVIVSSFDTPQSSTETTTPSTIDSPIESTTLAESDITSESVPAPADTSVESTPVADTDHVEKSPSIDVGDDSPPVVLPTPSKDQVDLDISGPSTADASSENTITPVQPLPCSSESTSDHCIVATDETSNTLNPVPVETGAEKDIATTTNEVEKDASEEKHIATTTTTITTTTTNEDSKTSLSVAVKQNERGPMRMIENTIVSALPQLNYGSGKRNSEM